MTEQELNHYLGQSEGTRLEFKEASLGMPHTLFETVTGFLNKEGGIIFLGVKDNGSPLGIEPEKIEQIKKDIVTASNSGKILNPPFLISPQQTSFEGKQLIYLQVPVSSQVHEHKGVIYDRENDSDLRIVEQDRKGELYFRKRSLFTDSLIYPRLSISDFSERLFERARSMIRSARSDHPWLEESNEGLLRLAGLIRHDFLSGKKGFTLAAALIFGKDEVIQSILPAYKVEAMVRVKNRDRYDDRLSLRTNLLDTYSQLMNFVRDHLPDRFYLKGDLRKDLREVIFREIIANIIVHREYTSAEGTNLIIYPDRVETSNPNKSRFRGYLHPYSFQPFPKNPVISKFFMELGWVEEIGSGIKNVGKFLPQYGDGTLPSFIEADIFRTILPLKGYKLGDKTTQVLAFLKLEGVEWPKAQKRRLQILSVPKEVALAPNLDDSLYELVTSWIEKGTKLRRLRIITVKRIPTYEEWKDTSSKKKGTKLYGKRMVVLMNIFIGLLEPCSLDELMEILQYKNRRSFLDIYIKPIMSHELIERTFPNTPNHPRQKYFLSEKGKRLLGGFNI